VLCAVVDMDMAPASAASGWPARMFIWMREHPDMWEEVEVASIDELQPGDVLINSPRKDTLAADAPYLDWFPDDSGMSHVALYIGNDMVRTRFPDSTTAIAEASYHSQMYPKLTNASEAYLAGMKNRVFRVKKRNPNPRLGIEVDYKEILQRTMGAKYVYQKF
jgi:hypothetical protein